MRQFQSLSFRHLQEQFRKPLAIGVPLRLRLLQAKLDRLVPDVVVIEHDMQAAAYAIALI
jgi:hypothetical protein